MSATRPSVLRTIARGLRIRCPACGVGHVFARGIESASACSACGWRLDRCPGHWVGGNEINLLLAFTVGVTVWIAAALALGLGTAAVSLATAATGVSSLALYRSSRGVFFAIDYLVDPTADVSPPPSADPDRGEGRDVPPAAPPRGPGGTARAPAPAGSSESFIVPPPAPYPPTPTVSP